MSSKFGQSKDWSLKVHHLRWPLAGPFQLCASTPHQESIFSFLLNMIPRINPFPLLFSVNRHPSKEISILAMMIPQMKTLIVIIEEKRGFGRNKKGLKLSSPLLALLPSPIMEGLVLHIVEGSILAMHAWTLWIPNYLIFPSIFQIHGHICQHPTIITNPLIFVRLETVSVSVKTKTQFLSLVREAYLLYLPTNILPPLIRNNLILFKKILCQVQNLLFQVVLTPPYLWPIHVLLLSCPWTLW